MFLPIYSKSEVLTLSIMRVMLWKPNKHWKHGSGDWAFKITKLGTDYGTCSHEVRKIKKVSGLQLFFLFLEPCLHNPQNFRMLKNVSQRHWSSQRTINIIRTNQSPKLLHWKPFSQWLGGVLTGRAERYASQIQSSNFVLGWQKSWISFLRHIWQGLGVYH